MIFCYLLVGKNRGVLYVTTVYQIDSREENGTPALLCNLKLENEIKLETANEDNSTESPDDSDTHPRMHKGS